MGLRPIYSAVGLAAIVALAVGCQPGREEQEVDPGAIPAAPDMRPGMEAAPAGGALPEAPTDTLPAEPGAGQVGQQPTATDTI